VPRSTTTLVCGSTIVAAAAIAPQSFPFAVESSTASFDGVIESTDTSSAMPDAPALYDRSSDTCMLDEVPSGTSTTTVHRMREPTTATELSDVAESVQVDTAIVGSAITTVGCTATSVDYDRAVAVGESGGDECDV